MNNIKGHKCPERFFPGFLSTAVNGGANSFSISTEPCKYLVSHAIHGMDLRFN